MISQIRLVLTSSDVAESHSNLTKQNSAILFKRYLIDDITGKNQIFVELSWRLYSKNNSE